jgi:hypothetical protein
VAIRCSAPFNAYGSPSPDRDRSGSNLSSVSSGDVGAQATASVDVGGPGSTPNWPTQSLAQRLYRAQPSPWTPGAIDEYNTALFGASPLNRTVMDWISNWTPRSIVMLAAETVGGTSQNVVVFPSTACEAGCAGSWALATAVAVWITTFGSTYIYMDIQ